MASRTQPQDVNGLGDESNDRYANWPAVVRSLHRIDPYLDVEEIDRFAAIQDEAGWDFAEFLQLLEAVTAESGVVVPKQDYPLVASLDGLERYLSNRIAPPAKAP